MVTLLQGLSYQPIHPSFWMVNTWTGNCLFWMDKRMIILNHFGSGNFSEDRNFQSLLRPWLYPIQLKNDSLLNAQIYFQIQWTIRKRKDNHLCNPTEIILLLWFQVGVQLIFPQGSWKKAAPKKWKAPRKLC